MMRRVGRALAVLLPLALGAAVLAWAAGEQAPLATREPEEAATAVRVQRIEPIDFVPAISAFGTVEPRSIWRAVAEVAGSVEEFDPELRAGRLVDRGSLIIRLDETDHRLAEARSLAEIDVIEARLEELELRALNLEALLEIEQRARDLAATEYARRRVLLERDAVSETAVDAAEEALLQRRTRVQELENERRLLPVQRRLQEAERAAVRARLAEARQNIERTRVTMPFDGRIADVLIERHQFVGVGEVMLVAEDLSSIEVSAPLRLDEARALLADRLPAPLAELGVDDLDRLPAMAGLAAELELEIGGLDLTWPATIRRFTFALDPATRTIGIVVGVEEPFALAVPGQRPPLVSGMFVEVVLRGQPLEDAIVVPRAALERAADDGWRVNLVDADDRLERRPVEVAYLVGEQAVIGAGLQPGERVVVSDLSMAIEGMLLAPRAAAERPASRSSGSAR